jgi:hypothetical protein
MSDRVPTQTHGDGKPKRSRSKGQQIVEALDLIQLYANTAITHANKANEIDVASVAEIIRLADKLRELIRIPR